MPTYTTFISSYYTAHDNKVSCAKYYTQISSVSVDGTPVVSQLNLTTAGLLASVGLSGVDSICE